MAHHRIGEVLDLTNLFRGDFLEVREVEAQHLVVNIRTLLLYMLAQHLTQGGVQQVGCCVVALDGAAALHVDGGVNGRSGIRRHALGNVNGQVVLTLGVDNLDGLITSSERALVTNLATHFSVERRAAEYNLVELGVFLLHLAITQNLCVTLGQVITHKLGNTLLQLHPVGCLDGSGIACALFLLLHFGIELFLINGHVVLAQNQLSQVQGETIGVIERECLATRDFGLTCLLGVGNHFLDEFHACFKRAQERVFLFFAHMLDKGGLGRKFRIGSSHALYERVNEAIHECFAHAQERVAVAHSAAQDAADDVARLGIAGQLTIGDAERDGAHVVGDHTHSHIGIVVLAIALATDVANLANKWLEHVGVVVRLLALKSHAKALKAHAGVDHIERQRLKAAVCLAVILHEHQVPDLNHLRVVLVDQLTTGHLGLLLVTAQVDVDFAARAAWAGVTHLPEVVVAVAIDDVVGRKVLLPVASGLVVTLQTLRGIALKYGSVEVGGVKVKHVDQKLPTPVDGLLLKVVAKRPVAQHLKHRVVVGVVTNFLQVVVLAAHAKALLRVGDTPPLRLLVAQNDVLELVHTGIGKHEGRVVLDDHWSGRHNVVLLALKEALKSFANLFCS